MTEQPTYTQAPPRVLVTQGFHGAEILCPLLFLLGILKAHLSFIAQLLADHLARSWNN